MTVKGSAIVVHYSELGLKGKNQPKFRGHLTENIRTKLKALGVPARIRDRGGMFTVEPDSPTAPLDRLIQAMQQVFGVAWCARAKYFWHGKFTPETEALDFQNTEEELLTLARPLASEEKSFAIRVNRADKDVCIPSPRMERRFGTFLQERLPWRKVDLTKPDVLFQIDLRSKEAYVYAEKIKGPGGLPVGTAGRVLALLSGGIDSPVAAYLIAKRGCRLDFIHFTATKMQQDEATQYKVHRLAQRLNAYTLGSRLFLVPYTYFDLALMRQQVPYDLILFRRFMARVAARLGEKIGSLALVSGDNLSQVASQTLPNLVSTSRATDMPIFRPLLGYDKEEIITLAERIGTYQDSIEPYKDCCALISRHPKTRSKPEVLEKIEKHAFPDYEELLNQTLADALEIRCTAMV